jgi:hypothetical protein
VDIEVNRAQPEVLERQGIGFLPIVNDEGGNFFYAGVSDVLSRGRRDEAGITSSSEGSLPSIVRIE